MPRYLLVQWTAETLADELEQGGHGRQPYAVPSSHRRLLDLQEDDVLLVAAVIRGLLHPVCYLFVDRVALLTELEADGERPPYPLPYQALAKPPPPKMNLIHSADVKLSLGVRKENGDALARSSHDPRALSGEGFRVPQWLDPRSVQPLMRFLDDVWDDTGVRDVERVAGGLAPKLTAAERKAIEDRAMLVVREFYSRRGYEVDDVHTEAPWDLTARHPRRREVHVEVKGTTGSGSAVAVTSGEKAHVEDVRRSELAIVGHIQLSRGRRPKADGGRIVTHLRPWSSESGVWTPIAWRFEPDQNPARHARRRQRPTSGSGTPTT